MYEWRPLPGLAIQSNIRWNMKLIVVVAIVLVLVLFLAWQTPTGRQVFRAPQLGPTKSTATSSLPHFPEPTSSISSHAGPAQPQIIPTKHRRKRLTPRQKQIVSARQHHRCELCHKVPQPWDREYDHRESLASDPYGERTEELNHIKNFRLLCRECHGYVTYQQRRQGLFQHHRRQPKVTCV